MHSTPNLLAVILFSSLAVTGSWSAAAQRLPSLTQAPASCTGSIQVRTAAEMRGILPSIPWCGPQRPPNR
jgi:hypothetical protein